MFFVRLKMNFPIDLKLLEYLLKKKKKKNEKVKYVELSIVGSYNYC